MSTVSRRIEISGSDAGFGRMASNLAEELQRSFEEANEELERMSGNATDFSDILEGRMGAIETSVQQAFSQMQRRLDQQKLSGNERIKQMREELTQAERSLRIETERARLAEKMRFQNKMRDAVDSSATPEEQKSIRDEHRQNSQGIEEAFAIQVLQLRNLRGIATQEAHNIRADGGGSDDDRDNNKDNESQGRAHATVLGGAFRSVMSGVLQGLGVAGLFSIAGFIGKMLNEGIELDNAEASTRGLGMKNVKGGTQFGKKRAEMLQYSRETAVAAGRADYDALNNLTVEKRFSQDENSLSGLTAGLRTEGKSRKAGDVTVEMLNYFKRSDLFNVKRGDFTQLGEKIQFNTRMLEMQGGQMQMTNATTNAQILELFGKAGIGDQRSMGFVESINQSITNPTNDFSKAFIMRSLRERNPDASLFELMKKQEEGIFGEGNFGQMLGDLQRTFQGDQLKMSVAQLFGLKNHQAEQVSNMSPADADRIGSQEDIEAYLKGQGESPITAKTGQGGVGVMSRRMAEMNDWFAGNGVQAIRKIDEYITTYEKGGVSALTSKMMDDITGAIERGFQKATDYLKEQFSVNKVDEALGIDTKGVLGLDGKPLDGTQGSVSNLFKQSTVFGGGTGINDDKSMAAKKKWIEQGFDYNQTKLAPPALTTYEPQYSRTRKVTEMGADGFKHEKPIDVGIMKGNDLAGKFKDKKVEYEIPDKSYGTLTAAQMVELFAFAVEKGLEKITLEQSKQILEHGFAPTAETLKQLQITNLHNTNKTYSTKK
jgi:hypothetical protein